SLVLVRRAMKPVLPAPSAIGGRHLRLDFYDRRVCGERLRLLRGGGHRVPAAKTVHRFAAHGAVTFQIPTTGPVAYLNGPVHGALAPTVNAIPVYRHVGFRPPSVVRGFHLPGSLEQGQTGLRAFRYGVACGERIQGSVLDFLAEEIEAALASARVGLARMQVVGRASLLALHGIGHRFLLFSKSFSTVSASPPDGGGTGLWRGGSPLRPGRASAASGREDDA